MYIESMEERIEFAVISSFHPWEGIALSYALGVVMEALSHMVLWRAREGRAQKQTFL